MKSEVRSLTFTGASLYSFTIDRYIKITFIRKAGFLRYSVNQLLCYHCTLLLRTFLSLFSHYSFLPPVPTYQRITLK